MPSLALPEIVSPSIVSSYLSVIGIGLLTFMSHLSRLPLTAPSKPCEP